MYLWRILYLDSGIIPAFSYPNIRWRCTRCAICCKNTGSRQRRIVLLEAEVSEICKRTGWRREGFARPTGHEPYVAIMRKINGACVFLDGNSCSIYEFRPLVCRFYPFWLTREDSIYVFRVTRECRGIGQGEIVRREHFLYLLLAAMDRNLSSLR